MILRINSDYSRISINQLIVVMGTHFSEVGTEFLKIILDKLRLQTFCITPLKAFHNDLNKTLMPDLSVYLFLGELIRSSY